MIKIFTDARCLEHRAPVGYPERPERVTGLLAHLRAGGWDIKPELSEPEASTVAARAAVEAIHNGAYVERLEAAIERGDGLIDSADNPLSAGTWAAAWGAVEASLAAADWVMAGTDRTAFAAVRPPGHHAERATAMGFCFFNNVAVTAEHLRRAHGLDRVAVVDFDVHHGNGTQHLFEERKDIFFASLHQFPFYPGTGAASEVGRGEGVGTTLNLPLPVGTGDEEFLEAIEQEVIPALENFSPQCLLLSAGFDAWRGDPLGGMTVTVEGYRCLGQRFAAVAHKICSGRSLSLLEGGYDLDHLGELAEAYLEGFGTA